MRILLLTLTLQKLLVVVTSFAFYQSSSPARSNSRRRLFSSSSSSSNSSSSSATATRTTDTNTVPYIQEQIESCIEKGDDPEEWIKKLEVLNPISNPNRSPKFFGEWNVWYTNCPPPSNGQLGPFQGTAAQVIDYDDASISRSYRNLLRVPPNDWLTATLDGIWEEWDGKLLDTKETAPPQQQSVAQQDWGAEHWKVTFLQLQIALLGYPIFTKKFDENTSRIWRTTYLDDEIRVVRAGKTGRLKDEVVFYTRRTPAP